MLIKSALRDLVCLFQWFYKQARHRKADKNVIMQTSLFLEKLNLY